MVENDNDAGHRRRVPRHGVHWKATYRIDDDPLTTAECEVVDISVIGVGIVLAGPIRGDLAQRQITVEVQAPEAAISLRLTGEIRYVAPSPLGGFRIGSQFSGLSVTERSILDTFEQMRLAW